MSRNRFFACLLLLAAISWPLDLCSAQELNRTLKVGALVPLSGEGIWWGENSRDGLRLAVEDINARPAGIKVQLILEDEKCDSKIAVSAFRKLTEVDGIKIVLGAFASSSTMAIAPLAERRQILLLTPCSEADAISQAGDYIFRTWPPNGAQARIMAQYIREKLGIQTTAILAVQNDFGASLSSSFSKEFVRLGGRIVAEEEFPQKVQDVRAQLLRIKAKNPEAIYLLSYLVDGAVVVKQIKELGLRSRILASSGLNSPDFFKQVGAMAEGMLLSDLPDSTSREFKQRFENTFHKDWPGMASCTSIAYDDLRLLVKAVETVGEDPTKIKDYLYSIRDFPGITGPITFDRNGDLIRQHAVFEVKNGKPERIEWNIP